jgi:hypothetical protein
MEDNPVEVEGHLALAKQFDHKPRPISIPLITVSGRTGHPETWCPEVGVSGARRRS